MKNTFFALLTVLAAASSAGLLQAQSLWNPNRPTPGLVTDTSARLVGDVLTVIISERQTIRNQEASDIQKDLSINASLTDFNVLPNAFGLLPSVTGQSTRDFQGDATYDKQGLMETRLAVLVIDVMPNGNMLVEGRRRLLVDRETKMMRFTGIVRPFDVTTANTIMSEMVANASIAYEGDGPMTVATNRGWLSELVDFVWPF